MLQGTARETPFHTTICARDNNFIGIVFGMNMRRPVISVVQSHDDAQKSADLWQGCLPFCLQSGCTYNFFGR